AALLVSTIPTFSGKLMGERIAREFVLPIFVGAAALVALLVTYPYGALTLLTLLYLTTIPISYRRFEQKLKEHATQTSVGQTAVGQASVGQTSVAQKSVGQKSVGQTSAGTEPTRVANEADVGKIPAGETKH